VYVSYEKIKVTMLFWIKRDVEFVHAPFYPTMKRRKWWILIYRPEDRWFDLKSIIDGERTFVTLEKT
jgi:hypothetical protein